MADLYEQVVKSRQLAEYYINEAGGTSSQVKAEIGLAAAVVYMADVILFAFAPNVAVQEGTQFDTSVPPVLREIP